MEYKYIVQKFVFAKSAEEAIKKEKKQKVDAVFFDEKWFDNLNIKKIEGLCQKIK